VTSKPAIDLAASVRERLRQVADNRRQEPQFVLIRYGVERLLYRLSRLPAGERFILKGAALFYIWEGEIPRPTRAEVATFLALLDFPAPRVRAYPSASVVAEKFQAMVALGIANTRMKDFYDLYRLSQPRGSTARPWPPRSARHSTVAARSCRATCRLR
jgi:hypothetical protein